MTGAAVADGVVVCAVTAAAAVLAGRFAAGPSRDRAASGQEPSEDTAEGDTGTRARPAVRVVLIGACAAVCSALVYARVGWAAPLPAACCLCAAGPPLAAVDLTEHRLPDRLTLPAIAVTAVLLTAASWQRGDFLPLGRAAISAGAASGFFLALALITRQVGGGDVKLAALTGMLPGWLGWDYFLFALVSGLLLAAIAAAGLIVTRRMSRRDPLPLGPFLLAGALVSLLA